LTNRHLLTPLCCIISPHARPPSQALMVPILYIATRLSLHRIPVLLLISLSLAALAGGLIVLACTGILGLQRLMSLGAPSHADAFARAPPAEPVLASPAPATAPLGSPPAQPSYYDAAALSMLGLGDSDMDTAGVTVAARAPASAATGAGGDASSSDGEVLHISISPPSAYTGRGAHAGGAGPSVHAPYSGLFSTLSATPAPDTDAEVSAAAAAAAAAAGGCSGALGYGFDDYFDESNDASLLASLSPQPVPVRSHKRSSATAIPTVYAAAPAPAHAAAAAGRSAAGTAVVARGDNDDAGVAEGFDASLLLDGLAPRARTHTHAGTGAAAGAHAVSGKRSRRRRGSRRAAAAAGAAAAAASDPSTAIALLTAFLTFAAPVVLVLLTVSGLLLAYPEHASAYVHVRWHDALAQHAAAADSDAFSLFASAAGAGDATAAASASAGASALASAVAGDFLAGGARYGVAAPLRRSHQLVTLALTITSTATLLCGILIALAATLTHRFLLPVAIPPVPAFASATPVAGVAAALLTVAGAVLDVANTDCAYTAAVAAALAAANGAGAAPDALSFFWGSSERTCMHGPVMRLTPAVMVLCGCALLLLVLLSIHVLNRAFRSETRVGAATATAATAVSGAAAAPAAAAGPRARSGAGAGAGTGTGATSASGSGFLLKSRSLPPLGMVLAQARRVLSAVVAVALPLLLLSLMRSSVGLDAHLLHSPAVAHDISVKVMGAHLLQTHTGRGSAPALASAAPVVAAAPVWAGGDVRAWWGPDAVTALGPFKSVEEALAVWRAGGAVTTVGDIGAAAASPAAVADNLGLTTGVESAGAVGAGVAAAHAHAHGHARLAPGLDTVKLSLARKVTHEYAKIALVAKVHMVALVALVGLTTVTALGYVALGAQADKIIALTTGEYSMC
jgi:hypothetical protein